MWYERKQTKMKQNWKETKMKWDAYEVLQKRYGNWNKIKL